MPRPRSESMSVPIWVPLLVLTLAVFVIVPLGDWWGMQPIPANALAMLTATGALAALLMTGPLRSGFPTPGWVAWPTLLGPPAPIMLLMAASLVIRPKRDAPGAVGSCAHCGLALFADHTGQRFYASGAGYLCPPEVRQPDHRRHRLLPTGGNSAARPDPRTPDTDPAATTPSGSTRDGRGSEPGTPRPPETRESRIIMSATRTLTERVARCHTFGLRRPTRSPRLRRPARCEPGRAARRVASSRLPDQGALAYPPRRGQGCCHDRP
jgi:hypothetical protein